MVTADAASVGAPAADGPPVVLVVMGPAGSGKSVVGAALAAALGWAFYEGDAFHPEANVARMRAGRPLGDAERAPWLAALAAVVARRVAEGAPAVLTCSALKRAYRAALVAGVPAGARPGAVRFVYLRADPALLAARIAGRTGHFFAAALLASQVATLEAPGEDEPAPVVAVDAAEAPEAVVARVRAALGV